MDKPCCETCRFWQRAAHDLPEIREYGPNFGYCRAHPPVVNRGYPINRNNQWCGEHEEKNP